MSPPRERRSLLPFQPFRLAQHAMLGDTLGLGRVRADRCLAPRSGRRQSNAWRFLLTRWGTDMEFRIDANAR